jgi:hypothetical protein
VTLAERDLTMHDDEGLQPGQDTGPPPEPLAAGGVRSLIDELRDKNARRQEPTFDRAIPNEWKGRVVVRYGRVTRKVLVHAGRAGNNGDVDLLIAACREVFVRDADGHLSPVREADGLPAPVRFDGRLADLFELKASDQRHIVKAMFKDAVAITAAAKAVIDWQTGANLDELSDEEVEELVGEEDAAT